MDYDPVPPIKSQWRYMNRSARGHIKDTRIVFNVGSGIFRPLYRDFEYDEGLAVDNNCGGDQRYNLQGRFEKPKLWKRAHHEIAVTNVCFIDEVELSGPRNARRVTWKLTGAWQKDPRATVSLYLEKPGPKGKGPRRVAVLVQSIAPAAGRTTFDLSGYHGRMYRIAIRKDGDAETGACSPRFDLELDRRAGDLGGKQPDFPELERDNPQR